MFAGRRPRCGRGAQGWTPVVPYRCEYVWYCGTDWEYSPEGAMTCEYIVKQFQDHWFPKGLKWIGHKMLLALWDKPVHRVHRIPNVHPLTRKFFEFGLKMTFLLQEKAAEEEDASREETVGRLIKGCCVRSMVIGGRPRTVRRSSVFRVRLDRRPLRGRVAAVWSPNC